MGFFIPDLDLRSDINIINIIYRKELEKKFITGRSFPLAACLAHSFIDDHDTGMKNIFASGALEFPKQVSYIFSFDRIDSEKYINPDYFLEEDVFLDLRREKEFKNINKFDVKVVSINGLRYKLNNMFLFIKEKKLLQNALFLS